MPDPFTQLPATLAAGDSLSLRLTYADYAPADGWTATLYLRGASALDVSGVAAGAAFDFTASATATAPLPAGLYTVAVRVAKAAEARTVESRTLTVTPNAATAAPGELQSRAEQMLAICRTARENILRGELKMYMIAGRQVLLHTLDDVRREEAYWQTQLAMERGQGFGRPVRFDVVGIR